MQPSELSAYELYATADGFFDPRQTDLTAAYVPRYFAEIGATADFRSGWVLGGVATKAFPSTAATPETVQLAEQTLGRDLAVPGAPGRRRRHGPTPPRSRLAVALQLIGVDRSDHRPRLTEDVAQDLLHLVELGLAADQRRSDLDDGVATIVGAAVQAVLEQRA